MKQRDTFRLPRRGRGWLGENSTDGMTDDIFLAGCLAKCRNYHLLSRGRLLKRQGWTPYVTNTVNGDAAIQGLGVYRFNNSETLIAESAGTVKYLSGGDWTNITGSLTLTTGQNTLTRYINFHDGNVNNIIGANDTNNPYYWPGTGDAQPLCLTEAADLAAFKHHVFAIRTSDRPTSIRYSGAGVISAFPSNNLFDCTRNSRGVGLSVHNDETLLAFYETEVFKIQWNYGTTLTPSSSFVNSIVDGSRGCQSRTSIITYEGSTYFYSSGGFYRIQQVDRPARMISRVLTTFLDSLSQSRDIYITAVPRGKPWSEVCWLISGAGETTHNYILVYNPDIADMYGDEFGWSVFESAAGRLKFNCGTTFADGNGIERTLLGGYAGNVVQAFGTDGASSTYADGPTGSYIHTELETGFLDFGYPGVKGLREVFLDLENRASTTFRIAVSTTEDERISSVDGTGLGLNAEDLYRYVFASGGNITVGAGGDVLNTSFILNQSYLVSSSVSHAQFDARGDGRYFKLNMTESSSQVPYTINALTFLYKTKGMRLS